MRGENVEGSWTNASGRGPLADTNFCWIANGLPGETEEPPAEKSRPLCYRSDDSVRVVCISGSPSPASWSRELMREVSSLLAARDWEVSEVDLRDSFFPMLDTVAYGSGDEYPHAGVRELREQVAAADAVVLATSVFHSSFSGLLKNALDHLPEDAFAGKPVGLLANAGHERGAAIACEHMNVVVKALLGWTAPTQVASSAVDFDPVTRRLRPGTVARRCVAMCEELGIFTEAFALARVSS
jgi:NAD(P)H-dependent FMN reductase